MTRPTMIDLAARLAAGRPPASSPRGVGSSAADRIIPPAGRPRARLSRARRTARRRARALHPWRVIGAVGAVVRADGGYLLLGLAAVLVFSWGLAAGAILTGGMS